MVVISNGFNKFHLSIAAAEASRRGLLVSFITGVYPGQFTRHLGKVPYIRMSERFERLKARVDDIPETLVHSSVWPEALHTLAGICGKRFGSSFSIHLTAFSLRQYSDQAVKHVYEAAKRGARLYHYRAGFGHASVAAAKSLGMFTLCDHSIVHPAVLAELISRQGRVDKHVVQPMDRMWSDVLDDIHLADGVLVNSHFVKETFLNEGWKSSRVRVIYLGVDEAFLAAIPKRIPPDKSGPIRLMFAGSLERRKGAEILISALEQLSDVQWQLQIAGPISEEIRRSYAAFLGRPQVNMLGILSRLELAKKMAKSDVFVFPSFAEGSARVVFEALASGCYVITTPNSGSIVEDGVHGRLISPGSIHSLANAVRECILNRDNIFEIGLRNADLIRRKHRQNRYGTELSELYRDCLQEKGVHANATC